MPFFSVTLIAFNHGPEGEESFTLVGSFGASVPYVRIRPNCRHTYPAPRVKVVLPPGKAFTYLSIRWTWTVSGSVVAVVTESLRKTRVH